MITKSHVVTAGLLLAFSATAETLVRVSLSGTELCYPQHYSPESSLTLWLQNQGILNSDDDALIYIPASEVKKAVPEYLLSHANQYTNHVPHDITGIAFGKEMYRSMADLPSIAWTIFESDEKYFVVEDEDTDFWRIYRNFNRTFLWHMVVSPPPEPPAGEVPSDWYVGHCLESPGGYYCRQKVMYRDIMYQYDLDKRNLHLRKEVASFVKGKIKEWIEACEG
jgi:hypothetical protein